jgi:hypothetical protein
VFETKVNPRALEKKAERMTATNVAPHENLATTPVQAGDTGDKMTPAHLPPCRDPIPPLHDLEPSARHQLVDRSWPRPGLHVQLEAMNRRVLSREPNLATGNSAHEVV